MNLKEAIETKARLTLIKSVCSLLEKNPDKNIPKIFKLAQSFAKDELSKEKILQFQKAYSTNPSVKAFIDNSLSSINSASLKKLFTISINNALWLTSDKRKELFSNNNLKIPYTIFINPSAKCNLNCCCSHTSNKNYESLKAEEIDKILIDAKELGINYVSIIGGEPFLLDFMYDIYKKHDDMIFTVFTNGTLFDSKAVETLSFLGNVIPIISLSDFHEKTDCHKGLKIYDIIMKGMDLLKRNQIPFGVYSILSCENYEDAISDNFIDILINKGSKFSLYFTSSSLNSYNFKLKPLNEKQKLSASNKIKFICENKPYIAIDLVNDASILKEHNINQLCCYIDNKGNILPDFSHNSICGNIKNCSLINVIKEKQFQDSMNSNLSIINTLTPCCVINNLDMAPSYDKTALSK